MQVGHRNLRCLFPFLEGTSWKTSASKHIAAYMVVSPLLISLFGVCGNGLLPDAMLQKAAFACHREAPFLYGEGMTFEASMNYFLQKLRQLASKLRGLLGNTSEWNALSRKLSEQQRECFLAMLRALQKDFCIGSSDVSVQQAPKFQQSVPKPDLLVRRPNMENQSCLQLAKPGSSFAVPLESWQI